MNLEMLLSRIPGKDEILRLGTEKQVTAILELLAAEFPAEALMSKAQDEGVAWKWYIEVPFQVPEFLEHAVKDALSEKWFDKIYVNPHKDGYTRMSFTTYKEGKKDDSQ